MAHPDDAELWAGGTIAAHVHHGGTAVIAVPRHDPVRDAEGAAGAEILGAALRLLADPGSAALAALLAELRPQVVITHPVSDMHPDHSRCASNVLAALPGIVIASGHPRRVYHCDSYNNLDQEGNPLILPAVIDITSTWPAKMSALRAHSSQPVRTHFGPMAETLARLHGARIGVTYAEAFRAIPVLGRIPATANL
jgi:LmbE family N-acetylglucosaminyl deacetylase